MIKINLLLGNIAPQIRRKKNFYLSINHENKTRRTSTIKNHPQVSRTKNKIFIDLSQRDTKRPAGHGGARVGNAPKTGVRGRDGGYSTAWGGTQVGEEIPATPTGMLLEPWVLRPHRRGVWGEGEEGHRPSGLVKQADGGGPPARQRCWAVSWGQGWMDGWTDGWMNSTRARGLFPMLGGGSVFSSAGVPDLGSKSGTGG